MRDRLIELTGLLNICVDDNIQLGDGFVGYEINYANIADCLITHGVMVQEWISVKDRLPEPFVDVLVYRNGKISIDYYEEDDFFACDFKGKRATHWQYLPQPPKGE